MATLRKASVYKKIERPFTRTSKVSSKSFIKTIPPKKIVKYVMGDIKKQARGGFNFEIALVSKEDVQLRDNSIESARQLINRHLEQNLGNDFYFLISIYPHHILREHKIAAVAQSDRFFSGMSHAFGKTISNAAQVKQGSNIFVVNISSKFTIPLIRKIYHSALSKLGCKAVVKVKQLR